MSGRDRGVRCEAAQSWWSAWRDGEASDTPVLAAHVQTCGRCQRWAAGAEDLTRRAAIRPATTPDLVSAAMVEWRRGATCGWSRPRQAQLGRALLTLAALTALVVLVGRLIAGGWVSGHVGLDLLAFEAAIAVGFVLAARRPGRYAGPLLPVVGAVVAITTVLAAGSLGTGGAHVWQEAGHLPLLAGLLGLLLIVDARELLGGPSRPLQGS